MRVTCRWSADLISLEEASHRHPLHYEPKIKHNLQVQHPCESCATHDYDCSKLCPHLSGVFADVVCCFWKSGRNPPVFAPHMGRAQATLLLRAEFEVNCHKVCNKANCDCDHMHSDWVADLAGESSRTLETEASRRSDGVTQNLSKASKSIGQAATTTWPGQGRAALATTQVQSHSHWRPGFSPWPEAVRCPCNLQLGPWQCNDEMGDSCEVFSVLAYPQPTLHTVTLVCVCC